MTDIQARTRYEQFLAGNIALTCDDDVAALVIELIEQFKELQAQLSAKDAQIQRYELKKDEESIVRDCLWRDMQTIIKETRKEIDDRDALIAGLQKRISNVQDVTNIQCSKDNWDYDSYMRGMANGLICAMAILNNIEPIYLEPPKGI